MCWGRGFEFNWFFVWQIALGFHWFRFGYFGLAVLVLGLAGFGLGLSLGLGLAVDLGLQDLIVSGLKSISKL